MEKKLDLCERVIAEDRTLIEKKKISQKSLKYLEKIGEELFRSGALEGVFFGMPEKEWENLKISVAYPNLSASRKQMGDDSKKFRVIDICPASQEYEISQINTAKLPYLHYGITTSNAGINFFDIKNNDLITIHYTNNRKKNSS